MRRLFVVLTVALVGAAMVAGPASAGDSKKPKNTKKAKAQIEEAYQCFLSAELMYTLDQKLACVAGTDDPDFLAQATEVQEANAAAAAVTETEVSKIKFVGKKKAEVTFDLIIGGDPILPDQLGGALFVKDEETGKKVWKVSALTICNLFSLANPALTTTPPCSDILTEDTV